MSAPDWLLPALIALPFLAMALTTSLARARLTQAWLALATLELELALALWLLTLVGGQTLRLAIASATVLDQQFELALAADSLSAFLLLLLVFPALAAVAFTFTQPAAGGGRSYQEPLLLLSLATASAAVLSANLLTLYVSWQLAIVCQTLLVAAGPGRPRGSAGQRFAIVSQAGALVLLVAVAMAYARGVAPEFGAVAREAGESVGLGGQALLVAAGLLGAGAFPFQSWHTAALASANPGSAAFLSVTMNRVGLLLLARTAAAGAGSSPGVEVWQVCAAAGALTALAGSVVAVLQRSGARSLASLSVAQVGLVFLALGSGSRLALGGALALLLAQALGLTLTWLAVPALSGLLPRTVAALAFATGSLVVVGAPPFPGFVAQTLVYHGLAGYGANWGTALALALLLTSLLTGLALVRLALRAMAGGRVEPAPRPLAAGGAASITLLALSALAVFLACFPGSWLGGWVAPAADLAVAGGWADAAVVPAPGAQPVVIWSWWLTLALLLVAAGMGLTLSRARRVGEEPSPAARDLRRVASWLNRLVRGDAFDKTPESGIFARLANAIDEGHLDTYHGFRYVLSLLARGAALALRLTFRLLLR